MHKNETQNLRDELSKLTGFLSAAPIKNAASQAVSFINKNKKYPISSIDSPIFSAYLVIFSNSKLIKNFNQLLLKLIDCIRNNVFSDNALIEILSLICNNCHQFEMDPSLKLLQYTTSAILLNFPDLCVIKSFFSVSLAFLSHQNQMISATAYASFQQMLTVLIDSIVKFNDTTTKSYNEFMATVQKEYNNRVNSFKNPLYIILDVLFYDLSSLSQNLPPKWLFPVKPPPDSLFELLTEIVQTYSELLKKNMQLLSSFQLSIVELINKPNAVPYLVSYISTFLDVDLNIGNNIISDFFQKVQFNTESNYIPVFFFHYFALQKDDAMLRYVVGCNNSLTIFVPLFCTFINDLTLPSKPIHFQMKQWKLNDILVNPQEFETTAIHEITFALLSSFKKSDHNNVHEFISKSVTVLASVVLSGLKYSTIESYDIPQQALFDLLILLNKFSLINKIENKFERYDQIFLPTDSNRSKFFYDEKIKRNPAFLFKIIETSPDICEDRWDIYMDSVIKNGISPSFANNFSNITSMDILFAILNVNPFPSNFLADYLIANINRFVILWPIVETYIDKMFRKKKFEEPVFDSFMILLNKCFSHKTEIELLRVTATFMSNQISLKFKSAILNKLKENVMSCPSDIREGWLSLFQAIDPSNVENDKKLIKTGFDILSYISCDYLDANYVPQCIDSIFSFIKQTSDDSISLLGFQLLSNISKRVEQWEPVLHLCVLEFLDPRIRVAENSLRSFFNILKSNDIIDMIVTKLNETQFFSIIDQLLKADPNSKILSDILVTTADFICQNWATLSNIPEFLNIFVPSLIEKHQKSNYDFIKFYLLFYQFPNINNDIEKLLMHSISSRVSMLSDHLKSNFNQDQSHLIQGDSAQSKLLLSYGNLIANIISQKHVKISIINWLPTLTKILLKLPSSYVIETFQNLINLFPLESGNALVIEGLASIIPRADLSETRKLISESLVKILDRCHDKELIFSCKAAFCVDETRPLYEKLLEVEINDENSQVAFECLSLSINNIPQNSEQRKIIITKLMDLFCKVTKDHQHQFIVNHSTDIEITESLWTNYFDIRSPTFSQAIFDDCKQFSLEAAKDFLKKWKNDDKVIDQFFDFIQSVKTPTNDTGENFFTQELTASFSHIRKSKSFISDISANELSFADSTV